MIFEYKTKILLNGSKKAIETIVKRYRKKKKRNQ